MPEVRGRGVREIGEGDINLLKNKIRNLTVVRGSGNNEHPGRKDVA